MDVEAIRAKIPGTAKQIYLNTGWQGPSPLAVIRAVQMAFERKPKGRPRRRRMTNASPISVIAVARWQL